MQTIAKIFLAFGLFLFAQQSINIDQQNNSPISEIYKKSYILSNKQFDCLVKNIWYEAGNQSDEGKIAVAIVTINRTKSGIFPKSICEVVYQKNQFSWTSSNNLTKIPKVEYNNNCEIAKRVINKEYDLPELKSILFFHTIHIKKPKWAYKMKQVKVIQEHIFYENINLWENNV